MKRANLIRANEVERELEKLEKNITQLQGVVDCNITGTRCDVSVTLEIDNRYEEGNFFSVFTVEDIKLLSSIRLKTLLQEVFELESEMKEL